MVVTSTKGYFLTILGSCYAKNNDATILNHMLCTNVEDLKGWFQEDDVFVVDRGFWDSLDLLKELVINAEMPRLLSKGEKQMTSLDANASRLVTKVSYSSMYVCWHLKKINKSLMIYYFCDVKQMKKYPIIQFTVTCINENL